MVGQSMGKKALVQLLLLPRTDAPACAAPAAAAAVDDEQTQLVLLHLLLPLQQQHCSRNHWFKKLSPIEPLGQPCDKKIQKLRSLKIRNSGYPGLGVPISYFALLTLASLVSSRKEESQETKGVDFAFQKLGAKPLQSL